MVMVLVAVIVGPEVVTVDSLVVLLVVVLVAAVMVDVAVPAV